MERFTALALLIVFAVTPTLSLVCDVRCLAAGGALGASTKDTHVHQHTGAGESTSTGRAVHGHHSAVTTHDAFRAPGSVPQASALPRNCTTHLAAGVTAPERVSPVCGPAEPSGVALAEAPGGPASRLSRVMRPPLVALTAAPLRI